MLLFKKILLRKILVFSFWFFLFGSPVFASEEFETSYQIDYRVQPNASVVAVQKIKLTNKLANIYASEYQISLGTTKIKNVWAKDDYGNLVPQIKKEQNNTHIKLVFPHKTVGKDKSLNLTLGYISDDYAIKKGRVLEIGIPKMAEVKNLADYQVRLFVPFIFNQPSFISPSTSKIIKENGERIYFFNKKQLENQSISAIFGDFQIFNFNLKYYLENKNNSPAYYEIALPPDSPFQKIFLQSIQPLPLNIRLDEDNNWLAKYLLKKNSHLEIIASGSAKIFMKTQVKSNNQKINNFNKYLIKQKFWETDDEEIQKLGHQLKTAKSIYNFVSDNLLYDYARIKQKPQRMGAATALKNKNSAVCMEFTDLFIALCRSAGIPAREVNGFAYTNNPKLRPLSLKQDVLHSWPQYYNQKKNLWISVDPTWGNTTGGIDFFNKLDLNHFAFVFHGFDSEFPLAAGSYKKKGGKGKDVQISFGKQIKEKSDLEIEFDFPQKIMAGLPINGNLTIKNKGNTAKYNQDLILFLDDFNFPNQKFTIKTILPFASIKQKVSLPKTNWLNAGEKNIRVEFGQKNFNRQLTIYSFLPKRLRDLVNKIYNWFLAQRKK